MATKIKGSNVTSSTFIVPGNFQVDGTTTTINSTTLTVDDKNIVLASGAANAAAANGAGLTVDGASASLTYASSGDKFGFNKSLDITGTVTADGLDVQGDGTISGGSRLTISNIADVNNDGIRLDDNTTSRFNNLAQDTSGNFKIQHWTGSAWQNNLTLTTGGNLGIGTTAPAHNVEIVATAAGSVNDSLQIRNNATSSGTGSRIRFINSTDNTSDANGAAISSVRNGEDNDLVFETENTTRMTIDHAGNVGIGTSSPQRPLVVSDAGTEGFEFQPGSASGQNTLNHYNRSTASFVNILTNADQHIFGRADGEKIRIDGSGNLLVGKTANNSTDVGANIRADKSFFTSDGQEALVLNRNTSDGTVLEFRKANGTVGSIGSKGGDLTLGTGAIGVRFEDSNNAIVPFDTGTLGSSDNDIDLGKSSVRWNDLYLGGNLYLGGTGSANALDHYEEGTFTPTIDNGVNSVTYSLQVGRYTRIGNQVTFSLHIDVNTVGGTTGGQIQFGGLPFTALNVASVWGGAFTVYTGGAFQKQNVTWAIQGGTTRVIGYNNNGATFRGNDFDSITGGWYINGFYYT